MSLKDVTTLQKWFGAVLRQPIDVESRLQNSPLVELTEEFITPGPHLGAQAGLELYAQQYWWRLYSVLQDNFPLLVRLFGTTAFNESIAKPFLLRHAPSHWNINYLGKGLVQWLEESYHESDRELILDSARLDEGWTLAFLAPKEPLPTSKNEPLYLAASSLLFKLKWSLFEFRKILLEKEPSWWLENDFPKLKREGPYYYLLRRTLKGSLKVEELTESEYDLLFSFKTGLSLKALSERLQVSELPKELASLLLRPGILTSEPSV